MSLPLTLENRLILACARTDPEVERLQDLVGRGPDWQGILRKVERWGLAPLLYASLRQVAPSGQVPKPVTNQLRHLYHRDTIYGNAKRGLLRATLLRFSEASIPVIVPKGPALAAFVYPSPTLRPLGDIELLVHRHDLDRAAELRHDLRDAEQASPYLDPGAASHLQLSDHLRGPGRVADRLAAAACIPIDEFWRRARPAQIESVATLVLSPEDLLLQLALHLSETHRFVGHLRTLCDIGETCRRYRNVIDWPRLVTRAESYGVAKQLYYPLRLARDLVGAGVPAPALKDLRASFGQLPLEGRFIATVAREALLAEDQALRLPWTLYELGVDLLRTRRARDGARLACRRLAHSGRVRLRRLSLDLAAWPTRAFGSASADLSVAPAEFETPSAAAPPERGERTGPHTAQDRCSRPTPGEVAVTYNQGMTDGVGSQLHRIYGLYALARAIGVKYVHSPLREVGYQGLMPLLTGRLDPDFTARYSAFFSLTSDDFDLAGCERVRVHSLDENTVERYREQAAATGRSVLLQGFLPYAYINRHPAGYQLLRPVSPYRGYRPAGPFRVCIHLRRGDNSVQGRERESPRPLPNAYYLQVCGAVVEAVRQLGAPFVVRLHTELPPRPYTLHPGIPGVYFTLDRPAMIDPADYALEDFEALPNLQLVLNAEARECLDDFATADVLILSLSSLGFVGGLLNPHGLVICPRSFHAALPDWLVADWNGEVDVAQIATRLADQLRHRA